MIRQLFKKACIITNLCTVSRYTEEIFDICKSIDNKILYYFCSKLWYAFLFFICFKISYANILTNISLILTQFRCFNSTLATQNAIENTKYTIFKKMQIIQQHLASIYRRFCVPEGNVKCLAIHTLLRLDVFFVHLITRIFSNFNTTGAFLNFGQTDSTEHLKLF